MREPLATRRFRDEAGYNLVQLMLVMGIIGVLSGMAVFQIGSSQKASRGDAAMRVVVAQLNIARELAISQRRVILVNFLDPGVGVCGSSAACVQTVRQELDATTTVLATVPFEGGARYNLIAAVTTDAPDAFGMVTAKCFGPVPATCTVTTGYGFTTDGTFIDGATGNPINGTLALSIPNTTMSYRAVTIFGAVGRVRAFRWNGRAWKLV